VGEGSFRVDFNWLLILMVAEGKQIEMITLDPCPEQAQEKSKERRGNKKQQQTGNLVCSAPAHASSQYNVDWKIEPV
jgi:hypothetical protein